MGKRLPQTIGIWGLVTLAMGCPIACRRDPRPVQPTPKHRPILVKYPIGKQLEGDRESFFRIRQESYIRRRAYPEQTIDENVRLRAFEQMEKMKSMPETLACVWRSVGPTNINGRVTSIAIDPSNNQRIFVTSVGGIWRSADAGRRWERVSDDFIATVFASVAINPNNGNDVYAGAGDPNYASAFGTSGIGIWHSLSGGAAGSWSKVTPPVLDGQVIFRLRIDPSPPNDIYAATSAGVFLGTAGGANWTRLAGFDGGTSDLAVDFSSSPRKVYAGVFKPSTSFDRGIWKYDGSSWHKNDSGIPTNKGGTIALAIAMSSPSTLYASVENRSKGSLLGVFKTTTAAERSPKGPAWTNLPAASVLDDSGYSWYNSVLEVDPTDAMIVYGGGVSLWRTIDGGSSWANVSASADPSFPLSVHDDQHAIVFDPANPKIVLVGNDGGAFRTTDTSSSPWHWNDISHGMVVTEFYKITSQQSFVTTLAGGSQDNGTEVTFGNRTWYQPGYCDGADVGIAAGNVDTLYGRCNDQLFELANPVPGTIGGGNEIEWSSPTASPMAPLITDPSLADAALSAGKLPNGRQVILKTTDDVNWSLASPTLASGQKVACLAIAPSSSFQTYYAAVASDASPPTGPPAIWRTSNGGTTWSTGSAGLPTNLWPNGLAVDYHSPSRAFSVFGGHQGGAVLITTDGGASWTPLQGSGNDGLPNAPATGVVIDPSDPNIVYVTTSIGVFRGQIKVGQPPTASWTTFNDGLPDGLDLNDIWVNRTTNVLSIASVGHGAYQRDFGLPIQCSGKTMLVVRDNVLDRGEMPSPSNIPDPEHPIPDSARPGFYKPDDTVAGRVYWWDSTDIRIDVPSTDPPANRIATADHVEMETCPVELSSCPPGTILDSSPTQGVPANVYVQVTNRGVQSASNVRVVALWANVATTLPLLPDDFWTTTFPPGSDVCGGLNTSTGWNAVDPGNPCRLISDVTPEMPEVAQFQWNLPYTAQQHSCMLAIAESSSDPIPLSVRTSNEVRPWVLTPDNRHIAVRCLHVVDAPAGKTRLSRVEAIDIRNPGLYQGPLDLVFSQVDMVGRGRVRVILPSGQGVNLHGIERVRGRLSGGQRRKLVSLGLDTSVIYQLTGPEGTIGNLPLPPHQKWRVAVEYELIRPAPRTAFRFTLLARQSGVVLGGSTFILRF